MRMALRSKKKLGFIDGIIPIPEGDPDKEEEYAIYGTVRSHIIQQESIPKLRTVLAQICKEEQHKNSTRIGDYSSDGVAFAAAGATAVGRDRRNFSSKFYCTYCKRAGHDVTGCFQLMGYPEWWLRNSHHLAAGHDVSLANNNKAWRGGRSGRGGRQQPQPPRARAKDGRRMLEAWANSASVRQGRSAAPDIFNRANLLAREEDSRGPGGPMHSGGLSTSSSGPANNGPGLFPALTVNQWSTLLTALKNSNNTRFEKLSSMKNLWILDSGCSHHMTGRKFF
ncbi:hypothetical protein M9H77_19137 [Catharanthus roseus]|uniref:Uncharacterized protein n=1 Tax=Catharanthus roseus TaxID=4058 RepID=A0ACC0B9F9_CATRO|nr:hypothetical protein M9H77_19137 [Catharanthus roseus]